jgi:hypothetical protein
MARHLSIGTVVEKNKIQSEDTFIILIDATIKDDYGAYVSTLSFCKNSENIIYGVDKDGNPVNYQAANFDIDLNTELNSEPTIKLSAQDQTRTLAQYIEAYGGLIGSDLTMTVVNSGALDGPPEIQETFKIIASNVNEYVVEFDLGTESAVNKRFPLYRQFRDRCAWPYKGRRCGYTGQLATCDYTLEGSNGCIAHANVARFGAFPSLDATA